MVNGIININKEIGYTSHDVVAKMRGILGQRKIGHTGTLDPGAAGVLPVCAGNATRLCDMLTAADKEYEAELLLGVITDTQDMTGKILEEHPVETTAEAVSTVIKSFIGEYWQVPPMYSAIKINGQRLYELAREGKVVERQARAVTLYELEILSMEMPMVKLRVVCSKGTYIRTLCADIGAALGCGGTMAALVRTRAGEFVLSDAITIRGLEELKEAGQIEDRLYRTDFAFRDAPPLHVKKDFMILLKNGNPFLAEQTDENRIYKHGKWIRVYGDDMAFYGIYAYDDNRLRYQPVKIFPPM